MEYLLFALFVVQSIVFILSEYEHREERTRLLKLLLEPEMRIYNTPLDEEEKMPPEDEPEKTTEEQEDEQKQEEDTYMDVEDTDPKKLLNAKDNL